MEEEGSRSGPGGGEEEEKEGQPSSFLKALKMAVDVKCLCRGR